MMDLPLWPKGIQSLWKCSSSWFWVCFEFLSMHAHLHLLNCSISSLAIIYFPISLSSWTTSCDIALLDVQQLWLYSLWAGIDPPACRLPSWVVISCRLPVLLQNWQSWIKHQARRFSHQASLRRFGWQRHTSPIWMCRTTRTDQSLSRRTPDHSYRFWGWCCQARLRQHSAKRDFRGGCHLISDTLNSCMISYLKVCDLCSDIIDLRIISSWYHRCRTICYHTWYHKKISKLLSQVIDYVLIELCIS